MANATELNSYTDGDENHPELLTKIIVIEYDKKILETMKKFLDENKIIGYKVTKSQVLKVLKSKVDLGAIFIPEVDNRGNSNIELALEINKARPELPLFLRRDSSNNIDDLDSKTQLLFSGAFIATQYDHLKELLDTFLFTRHYPTDFVNNVKSLSLDAFNSTFKGMSISVDSPYIVKDKIIYGELFSLMPLESSWFRGYMMLQSNEDNIMDVIKEKKTMLNPMEPNFRHVNAILGELSNMIWGSFKHNYGITFDDDVGRIRVEVPTIINHSRNFISFGTDDPQLCFKYTLTDPENNLKPIIIYQKFVFSLEWSPEKFKENEINVDELIDNGALELF